MEKREESMVVSTELRGRHAVIVLDGELDLHTASLLTEAVHRLIADGAEEVAVDAGRLTFADSSGLCALISSRRAALGAGAVIRVSHASDPLDRVLEMTGLRTVFVPAPC